MAKAPKVGTAAVNAAAAEIATTAPESREQGASNDASQQPVSSPGVSDGSPNPPASEPAARPATDKYGNPWDPSKHAKGSDGAGVLTEKGYWRAKRQSKSAVPGAAQAKPHGPSAAASAGIPAVDPARCAQSGRDCAYAIHSILGSFGPDWKLSQAEDEAGQQAMSRAFVAWQMPDFPPGIALLMVYGAILGKRATMESTQKRLGGMRLRIAAWVIRRRLRRQGIVAKVTIADGQVLIDGKPPKED